MRRILAAPLAAGLVLGGTVAAGPALAQTDEGDTSARANAQADAGTQEIRAFYEDLQQRVDERVQQFLERERSERSGAELQELREFAQFVEQQQQRANDAFQATIAAGSVSVTLPADFAQQLSQEFPQATRGLSSERLTQFGERTCVALKTGDVPGISDDRARSSDNSDAAQNPLEGMTTSAETEAAALVQLVLGTGDRTSEQIVEFVRSNGCEASGQAGDETDAQASGEADASADASAETSESTDASASVRDLTSDELRDLAREVGDALRNGDTSEAADRVEQRLGVDRETAERIAGTIGDLFRR